MFLNNKNILIDKKGASKMVFFTKRYSAKTKKGASKMLSLYWFVIIVLVAGGIFAMVTTFYGHPYDSRPLEADILADKTLDCISYGGELSKNIFNESNGNFSLDFKANFLDICNFEFDYLTSQGRSNYYTEILFFEIINSGKGNNSVSNKPVFSIKKGNQNWLKGCDVEEEYSRSARCSEKRIYSLVPEGIPEKEGKQYLIKVTSIIGKINENVK